MRWPQPVSMSALHRPVLIVSASGRAMAASATRAGIPVVVLDLFDDLDTRAIALASRACANARGGFSRGKLLAAVKELMPVGGYHACVVGSGLEGRPALLRALTKELPYAGNTPPCVQAVKEPRRFFPLLDELAIPHPEVRFSVPSAAQPWLSKRIGGAGGGHVRRASKGWPASEKRYFQRYQAGRVMSVLFLANAQRASLVGFSEQWPEALSVHREFAYGGAASVQDVPDAIRANVESMVERLVRATGVRGLNGLDFLLHGDQPYVIELNPRPTATIDLHDERVSGGLLQAHLDACQGNLPRALLPARKSRAHAVLWAPDTFRVDEGTRWPEWVTDVPLPGSVILARGPICSIHAVEDSSALAREQLRRRTSELCSMLWSGRMHVAYKDFP